MRRFKEMHSNEVILEQQVAVGTEVSAKPGNKMGNIVSMGSHICQGWEKAGPQSASRTF